MQHVGQCLGMHQAMLDGDIQQQLGRELTRSRIRRIQDCCESLVQFGAHPLNVPVRHRQHRPVGWLVGWQTAADRVNAEGKEPVKIRARASPVQQPCIEEVPIKGFQMPNVEDNPVPFVDRTIVEGIRTDQIKELVGPDAGFDQALQQPAPHTRRRFCRKHRSPSSTPKSVSSPLGVDSPRFWMRDPSPGITSFRRGVCRPRGKKRQP